VALRSERSDLELHIEFAIDPLLPAPGLGIGISDSHERTISSATSVEDLFEPDVDDNGCGRVTLIFPSLPLLKGTYYISVFLSTEDGVHAYDLAKHCIKLRVIQDGLTQGVVSLMHRWEN
jgi:lipopolysaccharide transport system ATP-binding protein